MRHSLTIAVVLGIGLAAGPAQAQTASLLQGGINRTTIISAPVDTSKYVGKQPSLPTFNLLNWFPSYNVPTFPPRQATSNLPAPSMFPSTRYPNSFKPMAPFVPGK